MSVSKIVDDAEHNIILNAIIVFHNLIKIKFILISVGIVIPRGSRRYIILDSNVVHL